MRLEIGTFPVKDIVLGTTTRWADGVLEINEDELVAMIMEEPSVSWAGLEVARPGDRTRIMEMRDTIEPKVKVQGPGTVYPGISGRPVDTVGRGRTHRLNGMTIIPCSEMPRVNPDGSHWWGARLEGTPGEVNYVDMSGPGAVTPFSSTINLCVPMEWQEGSYTDDWNRVVQAAMLKVNDYLAQTTVGLEPPEVQTYDLNQRDSSLPNVVFVPVLASGEYRYGPRTSLSTCVYGIGRLTQPWLLQPTEVLDGAICGAYQYNPTWPIIETIVPHMCARHGTDFNFVGCIVVRSNWEAQAEKQLMANRAAQLAIDVGAQGAIVTTNVRGQRFLETVLTVQALERAGINTILMTEEEDNENGSAPPLLVSNPELVAAVSNGTGGVEVTFPKVERVIGVRKPEPHWAEEMGPIHGRYGVSHLHDFYGFGKQGYLDF
ncbi:MAG: glycine/sarcosine/betaine reductase component B subunit [Dehalococcoidia bacterium]|jgi:glycine reductase|nr:glycine/sarcosine/betaine reductase component B subunit [Dehalococcoidia bacterium]MDP7082961.1 glycine/sarcosine/betaine reductase component B subunit [Dehalococcoidia bacterium]MDP7201188.1 glycine/sarcosine/betaine reductase component B subunit [Dehalococcoidia bacterium]MDP7510347.1 glycine/sarcosine/betaine reductase component B subunit [Dehalococcoidia bacterium]HJN87378.1 glycine/sarcosine/betaine reductase component B subunit [Dehalococcoidia bacterium]